MNKRVSNNPPFDGKKLLAEVKANRKRLNECSKHRFPDPYVFGQKVTCDRCKGVMMATEASAYCDGFKAAGGDPGEVWPAVYRDDKEPSA